MYGSLRMRGPVTALTGCKCQAQVVCIKCGLCVCLENVQVYLGGFDSEREAAMAYDLAGKCGPFLIMLKPIMWHKSIRQLPVHYNLVADPTKGPGPPRQSLHRLKL